MSCGACACVCVCGACVRDAARFMFRGLVCIRQANRPDAQAASRRSGRQAYRSARTAYGHRPPTSDSAPKSTRPASVLCARLCVVRSVSVCLRVSVSRTRALTRSRRRLESVLEELGVGLRPLPTGAVSEAYTTLRTDILTLLDLQTALGANARIQTNTHTDIHTTYTHTQHTQHTRHTHVHTPRGTSRLASHTSFTSPPLSLAYLHTPHREAPL